MSDYNRVNIVNGVTQANATNMNIIDKGIETNSTRTSYSNTIGGTANAITITTNGGAFVFAIGESVKGIATANNTGAVTAQVDGGTVYTVKKLDGSSYVACEADDFEDNKPFEFICQNDGTDFLLLAPKGGGIKLGINAIALDSNSGTAATTLRTSVSGSGYIINFGNRSLTSNTGNLRLVVDSVEVKTGNIAQGVNMPYLQRFETGFDYYDDTSNGIISYQLDNGSNILGQGDYNKFSFGSGTATTEVLNISGSGWLMSLGNNNISLGWDIILDGVEIITDVDYLPELVMKRFETSLVLKAEQTATAFYSYILD